MVALLTGFVEMDYFGLRVPLSLTNLIGDRSSTPSWFSSFSSLLEKDLAGTFLGGCPFDSSSLS